MQRYYTTVEQSKELMRRGLNPETADMSWEKTARDLTEEFCWQVFLGPNPAIHMNSFSFRNGYVLPCWSVGALLDVMPKRIENYSLIIDVTNGIIEYSDGNHSKYSEELHSVQFLPNDTLIQLAYRMVCWLLENGYREKIKKSDESR